jgi:hypothetical protein
LRHLASRGCLYLRHAIDATVYSTCCGSFWLWLGILQSTDGKLKGPRPQEPDDLLFRKPLLHVQPPRRGQTLNPAATQYRGDVAAASESDLRGRCVSPPRFRDLRRSASTTRAWTAFAQRAPRARRSVRRGRFGRRSCSPLWPAGREEPRAFNSGSRFRGTGPLTFNWRAEPPSGGARNAVHA